MVEPYEGLRDLFMVELLGWLCFPAHFLDEVGLQFDNTISVGAMAVYRYYAPLVLHTITGSCMRSVGCTLGTARADHATAKFVCHRSNLESEVRIINVPCTNTNLTC